MKIINLTPHEIVVFKSFLLPETGVSSDVEIARFPSQGIARATTRTEYLFELPIGEEGYSEAVPVVEVDYGHPVDLPAFDDDEEIYYIVSSITAQAARRHGRIAGDLLVTNDPVRNAEGQIIGCRGFAILR